MNMQYSLSLTDFLKLQCQFFVSVDASCDNQHWKLEGFSNPSDTTHPHNYHLVAGPIILQCLSPMFWHVTSFPSGHHEVNNLVTQHDLPYKVKAIKVMAYSFTEKMVDKRGQ